MIDVKLSGPKKSVNLSPATQPLFLNPSYYRQRGQMEGDIEEELRHILVQTGLGAHPVTELFPKGKGVKKQWPGVDHPPPHPESAPRLNSRYMSLLSLCACTGMLQGDLNLVQAVFADFGMWYYCAYYSTRPAVTP